MTYRDPPPHPTCPMCGTSDDVHRNPSPGLHWLCGGCWTTFTGTQGEYAAMAEARAKWKRATTNEEAG